jgi:hypothetical protein
VVGQLGGYAADGLDFSVKESEPLRNHAGRCGSSENALAFNNKNPDPQACRRHPGDKAGSATSRDEHIHFIYNARLKNFGETF